MTGRAFRLAGFYTSALGLSLVRLPTYWVPTLLFPPMLYGFFALPYSASDLVAKVLMASWCVYAVISVCFYQFGVGIADDRQSPWDTYLRSLPAGPVPRFGAQLVVAILFAAAGVTLVGIVATLTAEVALGPGSWGRLLLALMVGALPFTLLGIALGYLAPAKSAVPLANMVMLPLAFTGGLWLPPDRLPEAVRQVSYFLPTRHYGELAWAAVLERPWPLASLLWLLGYGLLFAALALWAYRRDEGRRYR